jgi:hypothetical protein
MESGEVMVAGKQVPEKPEAVTGFFRKAAFFKRSGGGRRFFVTERDRSGT